MATLQLGPKRQRHLAPPRQSFQKRKRKRPNFEPDYGKFVDPVWGDDTTPDWGDDVDPDWGGEEEDSISGGGFFSTIASGISSVVSSVANIATTGVLGIPAYLISTQTGAGDRKAGELARDIVYWARITNTAYGEDDDERWERLAEALDLVGGNVKEWVLDGDEESVIWINKTRKLVYLVFRGSKTLEDWTVTDSSIALGTTGNSSRFQSSVEVGTKVDKTYSRYKKYCMGHSLGGSLTRAVMEDMGCNYESAYLFNPGSGIGNVIDSFVSFVTSRSLACEKMHGYFINNDPISLSSKYDSAINPESFEKLESETVPHVLGNFLD